MHFMNRFRWGLVLTTFVGLTACTNNDIDPNAGTGVAPTKGSADFTKYVAVGNSLTAGFADGGLYRDSQLNSYPNILAGQFAAVGGGAFVQPLFAENRAAGSGYIKLVGVPNAANPATLITSLTTVAPGAARGGVTSGNPPLSGAPLLDKFTDANQNLGVPLIRVADILTPGYGSTQGNAYFERLLTNPLTTYLDYVSSNLTGATFFSCWIGNNDALAYGTSGGLTPLTPTTLFTTNFTTLLNKLTENSRKGVVIGIPAFLTTPYFQTVTIGAILAQINATRPTSPIPALVIQTSGGVRATQGTDLLMLGNASEYLKIGSTTAGTGQGPYGLSPTNPLPNQYVLDAAERAALDARTAEFNGIMKAQADAKGLAYVDPNTILNRIITGATIVQNGITYSDAFIQGGVYSLDGLHLTPAGYALTANEIIKSINAKYGSTVAEVNPANYRRVLLQQ